MSEIAGSGLQDIYILARKSEIFVVVVVGINTKKGIFSLFETIFFYEKMWK